MLEDRADTTMSMLPNAASDQHFETDEWNARLDSIFGTNRLRPGVFPSVLTYLAVQNFGPTA